MAKGFGFKVKVKGLTIESTMPGLPNDFSSVLSKIAEKATKEVVKPEEKK